MSGSEWLLATGVCCGGGECCLTMCSYTYVLGRLAQHRTLLIDYACFATKLLDILITENILQQQKERNMYS